MKQRYLLFLFFLCFHAGLQAQTSFATADTLSMGVLKTGTVTGVATQHYYKTALPANKGVFRLITSTSNTGSAFGIVQYRIFWKNQNTVNYYNVSRNAATSGADTFVVGALQADSLYILVDNVWAGQVQNYTVKYDMISPAPNTETAASNDTRATAELLAAGTIRNGYVGYALPTGGQDNEDYYKIAFPRNGTFRLFVKATYLGSTTSVLPRIHFYDGNGNGTITAFRNNNPSGFTWSHVGNAAFAPYTTVLDTFNVYGRAADTLYVDVVDFAGNWAANYELQWILADTAANNEPGPNETRAQASPLAEGQTINGDISYVGNGPDVDDYYRIVLAKDATLTLYASAKNTWNQQAAPAPVLYVEDKNGTQLLNQNNAGAQSGQLHVANAFAVPFMSTVTDTMHVFGRAKDTFYLHVYNYHAGLGAAYAAHYTLRYQLDDTTPRNEQAFNETTATAQPIIPADTVRGNVSYLDAYGNTDVDDYYRIVKPAGGAIVLYITGKNTWGYQNAYAGAPVVRAYDKYNNLLSIKSATGAMGGAVRVRNNSSLPYGQSVTDTMVISCVTSDTVYLHLSNYINFQYGGVSSQYQFRYELIPGPKAAFTYSRVGSEFGFVNNSRFADSYLWLMGNGNSYTTWAPPVTSYTIPNAYTVRLVTTQGACNYRDTAEARFTITGIEHYTPKSAGRGGDVAFQVFGGGLDSTTSVVFRQGSTTLTPVRRFANGKQNFLTAVMDLHEVPTGLYDVIITVPGQAPITYTNGFRVDSLKYPYAWSQVSGPSRWLANRPARFNLVVGNNGNVTASGVVVAMLWPKSASLTWLNQDYRPSFAGTDTFVVPALGRTYTVPRSTYQFIYDSVAMYSPVDSFEGKPYDGYIKFFQIPYIPANTTVSIPFNVIASAPAQQRFFTYTHRPNIFGSCPNGNQEDMMNAMSGELVDAVDGFADKTKIPLFQAFTKTAKIGQYHMRSAATFMGDEFWAWYDGYEIDQNATVGAWIGRTEEANQAAEQAALSELGNAALGAAVARAGVLNDRVNFVNKLLANNPNLSPKTFDKAMDILNKSGKGLGNINYDRLKLLKDLYDRTKDMADQSEKLTKLLELINNCPELKDQQKEILDMLGGELDHNGGSETNTSSVNSMDPNELYGPQGVGPQGYLNSTQRQPFLITFENIATASADAQTVIVTDTIDKRRFDISSLVLGDVVVGGQLMRVPQGRHEFALQKSLASIPGIRLRVVATTDTALGVIRWQLTALDSATNNLPLLRGFLPPNVNGIEGAGSVRYTISPAAAVTDGTVLHSRAGIVFDGNAAIATGTWTNTIDLLPPVSQVTSAAWVHDTTVLLRFSGSDATSGIRTYKVFYSTNNGPWHQLGDAAADSMVVTGRPDSSYQFYCVAIDRVENREVKAPVAEATIQMPSLGMSPTARTASFSAYPNPSSGRTYVRLSLPAAEEADLDLQTLTGQHVADLWRGPAGSRTTVELDVRTIPSGMYLLVLKTRSGLREVKKLAVVH